MPLETLESLQDLETTGTAEYPGSQQDETQYEHIESDGRPPAQTFHPSAPHPAPQAHIFEQPHTSPIYPPPFASFGFDNNSTLPIGPGLLDARFDNPAALGHGGGGVAGAQQAPWAAQLPTAANMDSFVASPVSLPHYQSSTPLVPGISSFEPMVSTCWSMDGSVPSTSASASRGPTMSSSRSARDPSTPASSHSPSSPRKVSVGILEPPVASSPNRPGTQLESRVEEQTNKKRRQASVPKAPRKTSIDKRSHRNKSSGSFTTTHVPIAPAPIGVASTSDDKNNDKREDSSSSSSKQNQTTTTTPTTTNMTTTTSSSPSTQPLDPRARGREAANRCRAKTKVAVAELEATERAMGAENQALTQTARALKNEVLTLKNELLMHGNCEDGLIQQYLVNSARMVGSVALGTTVTGTAVGGFPMQPPGPMMPIGPPLGIPPVGVPPVGVPPVGVPPVGVPPVAAGGPPGAMLSALPPGVVPGMPPPPSVPGAGTTAPQSHHFQEKDHGGGGFGGARQQ